MKCIYYPGCSQKASSVSYERSFLSVCRIMEIEVTEIQDWNCCGATVALSQNELLSLTLPARNLALAAPLNLPVVAPCPSCYVSLKRVNKAFKENNEIATKINLSLKEDGLSYNGSVPVYNILDFLVDYIGLEKIQSHVKRPLAELKVAPYYGCQIVSPYASGDTANPQALEGIIKALGAIPTVFTAKTRCCGGSLMITRKEQAEKMTCDILKSIDSAGAELIVTPCGLCQINLEFAEGVSTRYLGNKIDLPVLNITQLIGLAFGLDRSNLKISKTAFQSTLRKRV